MTLPYYDYANYPGTNPPPQSNGSQPTSGPPPNQQPFDYSSYNGPVCFPGGQTFWPSRQQAPAGQQTPAQQQPAALPQPSAQQPGSTVTYEFTLTPGSAPDQAAALAPQPHQPQQPAGPTLQVGQVVHLPGQSQPYVVTQANGDGTFSAVPRQ